MENKLCTAKCGNNECLNRVYGDTHEQVQYLTDWLTEGRVDANVVFDFGDYSEGCVGYVNLYPTDIPMEPDYD